MITYFVINYISLFQRMLSEMKAIVLPLILILYIQLVKKEGIY